MKQQVPFKGVALLALLAATTGCSSLPTQGVGDPSVSSAPGWGAQSRAANIRSSMTTPMPRHPHHDNTPPVATGLNIAQFNYLGSATITAGGNVTLDQLNQIVGLTMGDPSQFMHGYREIRGKLGWDDQNHRFYIDQTNFIGSVTQVSGNNSVVEQINDLFIMLDSHMKNLSADIAQTNAILTLNIVSGNNAVVKQLNLVTLASGARDQDNGLVATPANHSKQPILYIDQDGRPHIYEYIPEAGH